MGVDCPYLNGSFKCMSMLNIGIVRKFTTNIGLTNKGKSNPLQNRTLQTLLVPHQYSVRLYMSGAWHLCLFFSQLEPKFDLVHPIINGFKFGRLIHHILWDTNLTDIVQPTRYVQFIHVCITKLYIPKRPHISVVNRICKIHHQIRYSATMTSCIWRLCMDLF